MGGSRGGGGQGVRTPIENHKNIGFLNNSGPDPQNNYEATEPAFNVEPSSARQRNAIKMAFCWRAVDGPLIVEFGSSPLIKLKKQKTKKNIVNVGPLLTILSGSAHVSGQSLESPINVEYFIASFFKDL